MSPFYIESIQLINNFVHIIIKDANDEHYLLSLKLTADDLKLAFDKVKGE